MIRVDSALLDGDHGIVDHIFGQKYKNNHIDFMRGYEELEQQFHYRDIFITVICSLQ
jgi:hypothetical protein